MDVVGRPYKVYTALLTQTGTNAPVATVLENTTGGTITWGRTSSGWYTATISNSSFLVSKVYIYCSIGSNTNASQLRGERTDDSTCSFYAFSDALRGDGLLYTNSSRIEIRLYL